MKKYPFSAWGFDQYMFAVNDMAWKLIDQCNIDWPFATQPVYPINWYCSTGRASAQFIKALLDIRPDVIARRLVHPGSDDEVLSRIIPLVQKRMEASA